MEGGKDGLFEEGRKESGLAELECGGAGALDLILYAIAWPFFRCGRLLYSTI